MIKKLLITILLFLGFFLLFKIVFSEARIEYLGYYETGNEVRVALPGNKKALEKNEIKRTPFSQTYKNGDKFITKFYNSGTPQFIKIRDEWYGVNYTTTTKEVFERDYTQKSVSFVNKILGVNMVVAFEDSFFSGASDGVVGRATAGTWAQVRDGVGDTVNHTDAEGSAFGGRIYTTTNSGQWAHIFRGVLPNFELYTEIGTNYKITSSTLTLFSNGDNALNDFSQTQNIVSKTNIGSTLLATDYDISGFGDTSFASVSPGSWANNTQHGFLLNESGLTFLTQTVQAATSTALGILLSGDLTNTEPSWVSEKGDYRGIHNSETAGTDKDPILHVEYELDEEEPPEPEPPEEGELMIEQQLPEEPHNAPPAAGFVYGHADQSVVCQTFTTDQGFELGKVVFKLRILDEPRFTAVDLRESCGGEVLETTPSEYIFWSDEYKKVNFQFSGYELSATTTYALVLYDAQGATDGFKRSVILAYQDEENDAYDEGEFYWYRTEWNNTNYTDAFFEIYTYAEPEPPIAVEEGSTTWVNPQNGTIMGGNVNYSTLTWYLGTTATSSGFMSLTFSTSTDGHAFSSGSTPIFEATATSTNTFLFIPDFKTALNSSSTVYGHARLFLNTATTSVLVASSSVVFYVDLGVVQEPPIYGFCDPSGGIMYYAFCRALEFLFVPTQGSLNAFTSLGDGIGSKPPFGYFYAIRDAFEGIATSTESAFDLPDLSAIEDTVLSPLKTGTSFLLWILLGFWVFKRFSDLQI